MFLFRGLNHNIVYYEHDVYDSGQNMHGLLIAKSCNELFEKWSDIHFEDVYYWDEIVNENGIDTELWRKRNGQI